MRTIVGRGSVVLMAAFAAVLGCVYPGPIVSSGADAARADGQVVWQFETGG